MHSSAMHSVVDSHQNGQHPLETSRFLRYREGRAMLKRWMGSSHPLRCILPVAFERVDRFRQTSRNAKVFEEKFALCNH